MRPLDPLRRAWLARALSRAGLSGAALLSEQVRSSGKTEAAGASTPPTNQLAATPRLEPRPLVFPLDFGAHPATRIEWWYITGSVNADGGAPHGFQITFFRTRTDLALRQPAHPSRLAARQLLFAHAALSDVKERRFLHADRMARWQGEDRPSDAQNASPRDTAVHIGDWRLMREGLPERSRYSAQWNDDPAGFGMNLQLQGSQKPLLQGREGYSRKGAAPGHASFYYSQPQLSVEGTMRVAGRTQRVRGKAWLDHEWSESLLDPQAVGWDWVGMNLHDGSALTVFQLRRREGSPAASDALWAGGSYRDPSGAVRNFEPHEVTMRPLRLWKSPSTGASYPVVWEVRTPAGNHTVSSLLDAQELDSRSSTGTIYWEGLSDLLDAQGRSVGRGYLEMTGYAAPLRL